MYTRLYNPEVFQGNLRKKNYFEGWYFKQTTKDLSNTFSFIPGISLAENDEHAFIQIMDGNQGTTEYIRYPIDQFIWRRRELYLKIGSSTFTGDGISLDIENDKIKLTGRIDFRNRIRYPSKLLAPGIMGWYSFIPFMECNHGVVSVNHDLTGGILINNRMVNFDGGKGYIEKDWGVSFPEAWIWIQSNNFENHDISFMLSIARIPWMGKFFIGLISFLHLKNKFYLYSTYNKSVFSITRNNKELLEIKLTNKTSELKIKVLKNSFCDLKAPVDGEMSRRIKESIDSEVNLQLSDRNGHQLYEGTGKSVGLEIIEEIFNLISDH